MSLMIPPPARHDRDKQPFDRAGMPRPRRATNIPFSRRAGDRAARTAGIKEAQSRGSCPARSGRAKHIAAEVLLLAGSGMTPDGRENSAPDFRVSPLPTCLSFAGSLYKIFSIYSLWSQYVLIIYYLLIFTAIRSEGPVSFATRPIPGALASTGGGMACRERYPARGGRDHLPIRMAAQRTASSHDTGVGTAGPNMNHLLRTCRGLPRVPLPGTKKEGAALWQVQRQAGLIAMPNGGRLLAHQHGPRCLSGCREALCRYRCAAQSAINSSCRPRASSPARCVSPRPAPRFEPHPGAVPYKAAVPVAVRPPHSPRARECEPGPREWSAKQ